MSKKLEWLLEKKLESRKSKTLYGMLVMHAIDAVIANVEVKKHNGIEITDSEVIDSIKKEIKVYREAMSNDKQYLEDCEFKANILSKYLPAQLNDEQLNVLFKAFIESLESGIIANPKMFMNYLDEEGHKSCYDKSKASKLVLEFNKNGR